MWFCEWMRLNGLSDRKVGARIGVSRPTVGRYRSLEIFPSPTVQERIMVESGYQVMPNDWIAQRAAQRSIDCNQSDV